MDSPSGPPGEADSADTPILNFWPQKDERVNSCCSRLPRLRSFVMVAPGHRPHQVCPFKQGLPWTI